jgi:hypothetical protein
MPDWLYRWHAGSLEWWHNHPAFWLLAAAAALVMCAASWRLSRR